MAYNDFGHMLKDARERKGYDLLSAARRLRIRPDILRAIEACDYEKMPPRVYARNMVNAYARFVGLNPTEMTRLYLDGFHDYRNDLSLSQPMDPQSGFSMPRESYTERLERNSARLSRSRSRRTSARERFEHSRSDSLYEEQEYGRERTRRNRTAGERGGGGRGSSERGGIQLPFLGQHEQRARPYSRVDVLDTPLYTGGYSSSRASVLQGRIPFIVAGVVILILLVMVVSLLMGNGQAEKEAEEVPSVPVTGLTDTTTQESETTEETVQEVAPTQAVFTYEVASGSEAYIEIYIDDEESPSTAETLSGPAEESVDVTGTLTFVTAAPDAVSISVDGQQVELSETTSGTGVYSYTVDFPAILEQWNAEHTQSTSSSTEATSTSTESA